MEPTQNPGKRVQASHDLFWFYFLLDNKEVTQAYFKPVTERPGNAQTQKIRMKFLSTCTQVKTAIPEKANSFTLTFGSFIVKHC